MNLEQATVLIGTLNSLLKDANPIDKAIRDNFDFSQLESLKDFLVNRPTIGVSCYGVFDVTVDTISNLATTYRRYMLKVHPDRNINYRDAANAMAQFINSIYEVIEDENGRRIYDRKFRQTHTGASASPSANDSAYNSFFTGENHSTSYQSSTKVYENFNTARTKEEVYVLLRETIGLVNDQNLTTLISDNLASLYRLFRDNVLSIIRVSNPRPFGIDNTINFCLTRTDNQCILSHAELSLILRYPHSAAYYHDIRIGRSTALIEILACDPVLATALLKEAYVFQQGQQIKDSYSFSGSPMEWLLQNKARLAELFHEITPFPLEEFVSYLEQFYGYSGSGKASIQYECSGEFIHNLIALLKIPAVSSKHLFSLGHDAIQNGPELVVFIQQSGLNFESLVRLRESRPEHVAVFIKFPKKTCDLLGRQKHTFAQLLELPHQELNANIHTNYALTDRCDEMSAGGENIHAIIQNVPTTLKSIFLSSYPILRSAGYTASLLANLQKETLTMYVLHPTVIAHILNRPSSEPHHAIREKLEQSIAQSLPKKLPTASYTQRVIDVINANPDIEVTQLIKKIAAVPLYLTASVTHFKSPQAAEKEAASSSRPLYVP